MRARVSVLDRHFASMLDREKNLPAELRARSIARLCTELKLAYVRIVCSHSLLALHPPGSIAIRRVCLFVGVFVKCVRSLVRIRSPAAMAGGRRARLAEMARNT